MLFLGLEGNAVLQVAHASVHGHRCILRHSASEARGSCPGKAAEATVSEPSS